MSTMRSHVIRVQIVVAAMEGWHLKPFKSQYTHTNS